MTNLTQAIQAAEWADDLYQRAVLKAGYKSRWDYNSTDKWFNDESAELQAAYRAKVLADKRMHAAFEESRNPN